MRLDDFILKAQAIVDKLEYVETIVKKIYHGLNPSDRLYISCPKCGSFMTYDSELGECFAQFALFTVTISGREEDVATVLRLLRHMEYLGNVGASRNLLVWVDGDGCGQIHVTDESGEKLDNVHYSIEQNLTMRAVAGIYEID